MEAFHHTQVVSAWLPIRSTAFDDKPGLQIVDDCIQSFLDALPVVLPLLVPQVSEVNVLAEGPSQAILDRLSRNSSLVASRLFKIHGIEATVSFSDTQEPGPSGDKSYLRAFAGFYLEKALALALHLSELAYPGTIFSSEGIVCDETALLVDVDKKFFTASLRPCDLTPGGWPPVQMMDLTSVARWAEQIDFGKSAFASTRVQRTLAAFTHVVGLGWGNDGEVLFRSMQGLEAFYCDGIGDLRRQLSEKSEIWLGSNSQPKNIVGHLYDLRSKFVHGVAKLQYWHDLKDPWTEDRKTMEQFSDGVEFATRLLLSTLQKCIADGAIEVSWDYVCSTQNLRDA